MANFELAQKAFSDVVTLTRNTSATYWDRHGVLQTAAVDVPRFDHDPGTLDASSQSINLSTLTVEDISAGVDGTPITVSLSGSVVYPLGTVFVLSDSADIGRYISGTVTASSAGSVTFTVQKKVGTGTGSDWVTIRCLGLLVESVEATNLIPYSNDFSNWGSVADPVLTPNSGSFPAAVDNQMTLLEGIQGYILASGYSDVGVTYCHSVYAKAASGSELRILIANSTEAASVDFDLSTEGTEVAGGSPKDYGMIYCGGGIYRCWVSLESIDSGVNSRTFRIYADSALIWGAQREVGNAPTSYTPTNGSAVTRAADVATIENVDAAEWFNQEEFTIVAECIPTKVDGVAPFLVLGNSSSRRVLLYFDGGEAIAQLRGTQDIQQATIPASPGERYIFGVSYVRSGESVLSVNGSAATYINDIGAGLMDVRFGALLGGAFPNNLWVGDFRVFKHAKTAAELQELTAP